MHGKLRVLIALFICAVIMGQPIQAGVREALQPLVVGSMLAGAGFYVAHTQAYNRFVSWILANKVGIGCGVGAVWIVYIACPQVLNPAYTGFKKDDSGKDTGVVESWSDRLKNPLQPLVKIIKGLTQGPF